MIHRIQEGQALIKYGERGDRLYLIRYGKVRVLRPDESGGKIEVARLGRGHFVGERTLITGSIHCNWNFHNVFLSVA